MTSGPPAAIGIHLDDLPLNAKQGMQACARLGFGALQAGAASGDLSPASLTASGRRHVQRYARGLGLSIVALSADLGAARIGDSGTTDQSVEKTKRILELARDLSVRVVSAPLCHFDFQVQASKALISEALSHVADHADKLGRLFAIETNVCAPADLQAILSELNCDSLKVCYDPGQLLIDGHDPLAPTEPLADHIALSYLRDATLGTPQRPGRETTLGAGVLNVQAYLDQIDQTGYAGPHIIRRRHTDNPQTDLARARDYLAAHCHLRL